MRYSSQRQGILIAGNWIVDQVKIIDKFPAEQSLVNIVQEYTGNGGSAYNIVADLMKMRAPFPLEAIGLVGNDLQGMQIVDHCKSLGVGTSQLQMTAEAVTSYTLVMSVKSSGRRTFLHHRGSNSLLDDSHFDFSVSNTRIFHLGYLLLLDKLDEIQKDGATKASRVLQRAKEAGMLTSIDLVSEDSDRFDHIIPCSLPYVDYLFLNEYEAGQLSGIDLADEGDLIAMLERCRVAAKSIFSMGINHWLVIHFPGGVWAANREGGELFQPSLQLPDNFIVSTNGAGDALAAGVLLGIHEGWEMSRSLKLGVCAAASCLSDATCSDSILPFEECFTLPLKYGYRRCPI